MCAFFGPADRISRAASGNTYTQMTRKGTPVQRGVSPMPDSDHVSFARDIRPLFRAVDIEHMEPMGVALDDYDFMSDPDNAQKVYDSLLETAQPRMPIGGPYWSKEQLDLYSRWMSGGRKA
jgi:hypothetical protein